MRLGFAGPIVRVDPIVIVFTADTTFDKTAYPDYTNYDVIAIGGGGGRGGGYHGGDSIYPEDTTIRTIGGEGGGGGFHRLRGLLEVLDDSISITVGGGGSAGTDVTSDPAGSTTDGGDGGTSWFSDFCVASGGKGGKRATTDSIDTNLYADGGDGGLGGQSVAGFGAKGGVAGFVYDPDTFGHTAGKPGGDGIFTIGPYEFEPGYSTVNGYIGAGGGGGAGGIGKVISPSTTWEATFPLPTAGGKGSYDSDQAIFGPGGDPKLYTASGNPIKIVPGFAGGARISLLNRSNKVYGNSGQPGVVALRLTKE